MVIVALRSPLRDLAGQREVSVDGATVQEALRELERARPRLCGWVVDERGSVREHLAIFRNGERVGSGARVDAGDRLQVLPSISGGAVATATEARSEIRAVPEPEPHELLVGTRKGLFVFRGPRGGRMEIAGRAFEGAIAEFAMRDRRSGTYFASVTDMRYGPRVYLSSDPLGEWEIADGPAFPEDSGGALERTWLIREGVEDDVLWAGVAPAALFRSEDSGRSWQLNRGLWDDPSREEWQPGFGGLALHSICPWPGEPDRLAVGISAAGVWLTEDRGRTWRRGNKGLVPRYLPEEAREGAVDLCVHNMHRAPLQPTTLYMQFHGGVYRSDDAGESWADIGSEGGLPSDFGFPMVLHPGDPDRAFVIPLTADGDRITCGAAVRVFETSDRGETWQARGEGLPQSDAYLTVLRQAFCRDDRRPVGLYFGAESGDVFGSADGGRTWSTVAEHLPQVTSVRCSS